MTAWRVGAEAVASQDEEPDMRAEEASETKISTEVFSRLTKWIPADALAIYTLGVTTIASSDPKPSLAFVLVMIAVTPTIALLSAFSLRNPIGLRLGVGALLSAGAFTIWTFSIPMNGWQRLHFVGQNPAIFAVGAVIAALLFGLLAEGIDSRLR